MTRTLSAPPRAGQTKAKTSIRGVVGRAFLGLVVLAMVAAITYAVSSPWVSTWGATDEEVQAALPGDEVAPQATPRSTRDAVLLDLFVLGALLWAYRPAKLAKGLRETGGVRAKWNS